MGVGVRLALRIIVAMYVSMMLVVNVSMLVLHRLVNVLVLVALRKMEINANGHEQTGRYQAPCHGLSEHPDCEERSDKWSGRKIRACSRGTQVPKREHEHDDAHAIPENANQRGGTYHIPTG